MHVCAFLYSTQSQLQPFPPTAFQNGANNPQVSHGNDLCVKSQESNRKFRLQKETKFRISRKQRERRGQWEKRKKRERKGG